MGKQDETGAGRKGRKRGRVMLLLLIAAAAGWYVGFRLPEEKRNRAAKLLTEAREMPFRLFV